MSSNKLLNDLTDEDLLKIAGEQYKQVKATDKIYRKDLISDHNHDVLNFILSFNFKEGKKKVNKKLLFRLYKSWSRDAVTYQIFCQQLHVYFSKHSKATIHLNADNRFLGSATYKLLNERKKCATPQSSPVWQKHFESFISAHNIKNGDNYLEAIIIHHLYERWRYENKIKSRMGRIVFARMLALKFPVKKSGPKSRSFIGINNSIFNYLTEESIKNVREAWQTKSQKKNKKI